LFYGEEQIVNRIVEIEEADVGLKAEAEFCGIGANENGGSDGRFGGAVEGFDFGPLETNHVESKLQARGTGGLGTGATTVRRAA
jgi:hypothetical protein